MPTAARPEEHWLFQTPELETLYTDWVKAGADIAFTEKQLAKIRELALARTSYQQSVVDRLKKLAESGSGAQRDLLAAEAERLQGQLQAQKDIYEAENAVQSARRTRASLERQLYQAGLDPRLLERPKPSTDLVVADVPEARLNLVGLGQKCEARFYAFPGEVFKGEVVSLSPTLSRERRTLRVLFLLVDPGDRLKPGLFADIGLGTEPHRRLLVPADAVLHVGRSDYVFVADDETGVWRVAEVGLGDAHGSRYEVLSGLRAGDRVIARGAILLKPLLLEALAR
jgi:multidrug efflux pump subunit AcrA (membrane-fusion protein)